MTAVASVALTLVLVLAGAGLVLLQRASLIGNLDQTLDQRAGDIETLLARGGEGFLELPATTSEGFAQVVDVDAKVVAATPNLNGEPSLGLESSPGGDTFSIVTGLEVDDDAFRVLSRPLDDGGVIYVATTYDVVGEAVSALVASLALLIPGVVVVLGLLTWWLVGRTLRPVEDIRAEVAAIGAGHLDRRVPEPGTRDEIDRLASTMNQMLGRIGDSVARESQFVADASHELRSPLTRLRAEVELLMRTRGREPALESLHEDILIMQDIVEDLLFLARSDAGADLSTEEVDLDDLVIDECRHESPIHTDVSSVSAALVIGNRTMLHRAVANLLDNARRHAHSRVEVSLFEDVGSAVLRVQDDGPGVPSAAAESIFDRFSRLDEARRPGGGTGLGLAIAREVALAHGGSLHLVNPGEAGAVFEMRVPLKAT